MLRNTAIAAILLFTSTAAAQDSAGHIALGDRATRALEPSVALRHYESAIAAEPRNHEALWKAAQAAVDLGEFNRDASLRAQLFRRAEGYAQRAVEIRPDDAEGHFHLARSKGMVALSVGIRERVTYATDIHEHATHALRMDSDHPGALHVLGVWHAEVMRLNSLERLIARQFLGGRVLGEASWDVAARSLERAVAVDPGRLTHHLSLARIYRDTKQTAKARERYEHVIRSRATSYNDPEYKRAAERELARLR